MKDSKISLGKKINSRDSQKRSNSYLDMYQKKLSVLNDSKKNSKNSSL